MGARHLFAHLGLVQAEGCRGDIHGVQQPAKLLACAQHLRVLDLKLIWRDGDDSGSSLTAVGSFASLAAGRDKSGPYSLWPAPRNVLTATPISDDLGWFCLSVEA